MKWHRDIEGYNIAKCFLNVRNGEILEFIERYCNMESGRIPTIPNFILSHSPLNSFDFSRLFAFGYFGGYTIFTPFLHRPIWIFIRQHCSVEIAELRCLKCQ